MTIRENEPVRWVDVLAGALQEKGLAPYSEGEIRNLFDWAENPAATSDHLMAHCGQFLVDVVSIAANAVHQPSKPGDEIVVVLAGKLRLTDDGDGREQDFEAGEIVLIPAGWAGLYRVVPDGARFLELAIVPYDYFEPAITRPPSGLSPRRLEWPETACDQELHRGRYLITGTSVAEATSWAIDANSDIIIRVIDGTLALTNGLETASFGADAVIVLPAGFTGYANAGGGYRALTARWLG